MTNRCGIQGSTKKDVKTTKPYFKIFCRKILPNNSRKTEKTPFCMEECK